jgi:Zn-dependent protease
MGIDLILAVQIAVVLLTILFSMTLHEVTHGYVAYRLGDDTAYLSGRLTLNPLKHIDLFLTILLPLLLVISGGPPFGGAKPVPINPARLKYDEYGAALVAVAGPLTNLVLAIVSGFWLRFVIGFEAGNITEYVLLFMIVNLGFFIFNMIPIPPLDGSRILFSVAPDGVRDFMRVIERNGLMVILVIVVFFNGFISSYMITLIEWLGSLILGVNLVF